MSQVVSLLCLLVLASSSSAPAAQSPTAEEARIRLELAGWVEAWNQGDAEAVAAFYSPDAVRTLPNGVALTGRAQIRGAYLQAFTASLPEGVDQRLAMKVLSIRLLEPEVAVVDYEYHATGIPLVPELEIAGRTTLVMKKQGEHWLRAIQSNWIPTTPDCYRHCARD